MSLSHENGSDPDNPSLPEILIFAGELKNDPQGKFSRPVQLARALVRAGFSITIALPDPESVDDKFEIPITPSEARTLPGLLKRHDVVISTGSEYGPREMARESFIQIFDVADLSFHQLACVRDNESARLPLIAETGDLLLCANIYQRDFWHGAATAFGRFAEHEGRNLSTHRIGAIVPNGHDGSKPPKAAGQLRGALQGIRSDDTLFVWNSDYESFLDPLGALEALAQAIKTKPEIKILFLPPRPTASTEETQLHAEILNAPDRWDTLKGKVFFLNDSFSEEERLALLSEADAALIFSADSPGARIWAGRPFTEAIWARVPFANSLGGASVQNPTGDSISVAARPGDIEHMAEKILELTDPGRRNRMIVNLDRIHADFSWDRVVQPLAEYLRNLPKTPARHDSAEETGWGMTIRRTVEKFFG